MRPKATVNETQWEMFLLYPARQPFPPSWEGARFLENTAACVGLRTTLAGPNSRIRLQRNWGRQPSWVNCIDGDSSELLQPPNGRAPDSGNSRRDPSKRKGKGIIKLGLSFPVPSPLAPFPPGAPCRPRPQHVFSTCCRWRRTSMAFSQGTTLARKELGSAFCASWIRRCMG